MRGEPDAKAICTTIAPHSETSLKRCSHARKCVSQCARADASRRRICIARVRCKKYTHRSTLARTGWPLRHCGCRHAVLFAGASSQFRKCGFKVRLTKLIAFVVPQFLNQALATGAPPAWMEIPLAVAERVMSDGPNKQFTDSLFEKVPSSAMEIGRDDLGRAIHLCKYRPDLASVSGYIGFSSSPHGPCFIVYAGQNTNAQPRENITEVLPDLSGRLFWDRAGRHRRWVKVYLPMFATTGYADPVSICAVEINGRRYPGLVRIPQKPNWGDLNCMYKRVIDSAEIHTAPATNLLLYK